MIQKNKGKEEQKRKKGTESKKTVKRKILKTKIKSV